VVETDTQGANEATVSDAEWDEFAADIAKFREYLRSATLSEDHAALHELRTATLSAAPAISTDSGGDTQGRPPKVRPPEVVLAAMKAVDTTPLKGLPPQPQAHARECGELVQREVHDAREKGEDEVRRFTARPVPDTPVEKDPEYEAWRAKMFRIRDEAKKKIDDSLDEAFNKLVEYGKDPSTRAKVTAGCVWLQVVTALAVELLSSAIEWLKKNLKAVWQDIENGANWTWEHVVEGADIVRGWFS